MAFSVSDVISLTQARASLSELADQVKAGAEKILTKNGESYVAMTPSDWTTTTSWNESAFICC